MNIKDIVHESVYGICWVYHDRNNKHYDVMLTTITHSKCISTFDDSEDGLSLAIAYSDYMDKRKGEKK